MGANAGSLPWFGNRQTSKWTHDTHHKRIVRTARLVLAQFRVPKMGPFCLDLSAMIGPLECLDGHYRTAPQGVIVTDFYPWNKV